MNTADITLRCPKCETALKVRSDAAGKKVRCSGIGCGAIIGVPAQVPGSPLSDTGMKGQVMSVIGLIFAGIAAVLASAELKARLDLDEAWLISFALVALAVASEFLRGVFRTAAHLLLVLVGLATPALFYILARRDDQRALAMYIGVGVFFMLSGYLVARTSRIWRQFDLGNRSRGMVNMQSGVVWFALIASSIAFAWVTYYRFFSPLSGEEYLARRFAFTFFFVVVGVACTLFGRNSPLPFLTVMGLTYMSVGVLKALTYDIVKTDGILRIGVFAACGAVMLLGGFLMKRRGPSELEPVGVYASVIED